MKVLVIENEEHGKQFEEMLKTDKPILILHHASWCPHCVMFMPEWKKVTDALAPNTDINVVELEISNSKFVNTKYTEDVRGYPTIRIIKNRVAIDEYKDSRTDWSKIANFAKAHITVKSKSGKTSPLADKTRSAKHQEPMKLSNATEQEILIAPILSQIFIKTPVFTHKQVAMVIKTPLATPMLKTPTTIKRSTPKSATRSSTAKKTGMVKSPIVEKSETRKKTGTRTAKVVKSPTAEEAVKSSTVKKAVKTPVSKPKK